VFRKILLITALLVSMNSWGELSAKTTALFFLNGDNNLEFFGNGVLQGITRAKLGSEVTALVQIDGPKENDSRRVAVTDRGIKVLNSNLEYDMGDAKTLASFIDWGMSNYPADKYYLFYSGHGHGILPFSADGSDSEIAGGLVTLNFSPDDSAGSSITTKELTSLVGTVMKNNPKAKPFEMILFNACLMANREALLPLAQIAKVAVASEFEMSISKYGFNSYYGDLKAARDYVGIDVIPFLESIADKKATEEQITYSIMSNYKNNYKNGIFSVARETYHYPVATMAAINLAELKKNESLLERVGKSLLDGFNRGDKQLFQEVYVELIKYPVVYWNGYFDYALLMDAIYAVTGSKEAQLLSTKLKSNGQLIIDRSIQFAEINTGLSLYFPHYTFGLPLVMEDLDGLVKRDDLGDGAWSEFVQRYIHNVNSNMLTIVDDLIDSYLAGNLPQIHQSKDPAKSIDHLFNNLAFVTLMNLNEKGEHAKVRAHLAKYKAFKADPVIANYLSKLENFITN